MTTRGGYIAIPDVEKAVERIFPLSPRELYPEANAEEAELLGTIDACIDESHIDLRLMKNTPDAIGTYSSSFCSTLSLPVCVSTGLVFLAITGAPDDISGKVSSPFVSAGILWLTSVRPISKRLIGQALLASISLESLGYDLNTGIDEAVNTIVRKIDTVNKTFTHVVRNMHTTLDNITSTERKQLKLIDSITRFPDPSDTCMALDRDKEGICAIAQVVKDTVNVEEQVPAYLQSTTKYWWKVLCPVLVVCLAFQIGGAVLFSTHLQRGAKSILHLQGEKELNVLFVATSFGLALGQIGLVYLATRSDLVAGSTKGTTDYVSERVDKVAWEVGLHTVVEATLGEKMITLKSKLLHMIHVMNEIEETRAKVVANPATSSYSMHSASSPCRKKARPRLARFFGSCRK